ncbi:MAG: TetR/AcrR family transcriptional regulator [Candidatus Thorarchaeota archaeon]|nr:MAG: TetR/AcrR family transcriptional regulator [Candidatus Thorarchaeota archaeon]
MTQSEKKFSRDKEAKKEAIIEALSELISEKGYSRTSVRDIPERAGLSIGTIYRYFPKGKIDIVKEILNRNTSRIIELEVPDKFDSAAFAKLWSYMIDLAIEVRKKGLIMADNFAITEEIDIEAIRDITTTVLRFYRWLASRFKEIDRLAGCSEAELVRRIVVMMQIIDSVINKHLKYPLFDDDKSMSKYLLRVVDLTFESCQ